MKELKSYIISHQEIDPTRWDQFILNSPQGNIYALYAYTTIIRDDWQAIIVEEKGEWIAIMPFCINKRWKYRSLPQPMLTQHWGIFFAPFDEMGERKSFSKKEMIVSSMIPLLDDIDLFVQNFSTTFDYPLPFHWADYELKTKYTYYLDLSIPENELFMNVSPPLRRQIRKAEKKGLTTIDLTNTKELEQLFRLNQNQGHNIVGNNPESFQKIREIGDYLVKSNQGLIKAVVQADGIVLAVSVFAFFQDKMLYLMGAYHPDFGNSGAGSLLMWTGIQEGIKKEYRIFDFEGSMIKGVEHFFRKFGAYPVPYIQIYKNRLPLILRWIQKSRT